MWQHWQRIIKEEAEKYGYGQKEEVHVSEATFIRQQQWEEMRSKYKPGTPVTMALKIGKIVSGTLLRMDKYDMGSNTKGHFLHVKTNKGNEKVFDVDVKSIQWNNDPNTSIGEEAEIEEAKAPRFPKGFKQGETLWVPPGNDRGELVSWKAGKNPGGIFTVKLFKTGKTVEVSAVDIYKANSPKLLSTKEEVEEAYAPLDTKGIVGAFTEATKKKRFEYRNSTDSWGKSHGFPHEVCVSSPGGGLTQWRSANVKGTVCYIVVDEGEEGKPVTEKWVIRNHVKYVKAESVEEETEQLDEAGVAKYKRIAVAHAKAKYGSKAAITNPEKAKRLEPVLAAMKAKVQAKARAKGLPPAAFGMKEETEQIDEAKFNINDLLDSIESAYKKGGLKGVIQGGKQFGLTDRTTVDELLDSAKSMFGADLKKAAKEIKDFLKPQDYAKYKTKMESVEESNNWKQIYEAKADEAANLANEIRKVAKNNGVSITVESNTSVSFSKDFTKGNMDEFFAAYRDCDQVRRMVKFKSRGNEWGCGSSGFGIGAQECVKSGKVRLSKSGDGASYLLKAISKRF